MKTSIYLIVLVLALILAGCGLNVVDGSGRIMTASPAVSGFEAVTLAGNGLIILSQGQSEALTIEADDNILPHIETQVRNGVLIIGYDDQDWNTFYRPSQPIRFNLTVKDLTALNVSGSGEIRGANITTDRLELNLSGSGHVAIESLEATDLTVDVSGSGEIDLAGRVDRQTVELAGMGAYRAGDLDSRVTRVTVSGSGQATVWAQERLTIDVSGSGQVNYYGDPSIIQSNANVRQLEKQ